MLTGGHGRRFLLGRPEEFPDFCDCLLAAVTSIARSVGSWAQNSRQCYSGQSSAPQTTPPASHEAQANHGLGFKLVPNGSRSSGRSVLLGRLPRRSRLGVKFVNNPIITEYVTRIGQKLARNSDAKALLAI